MKSYKTIYLHMLSSSMGEGNGYDMLRGPYRIVVSEICVLLNVKAEINSEESCS